MTWTPPKNYTENRRYVSMNFVENFNALFDQSFFVFLDTKLFEQVVPTGAHGVLTSLCLYAPKVGPIRHSIGWGEIPRCPSEPLLLHLARFPYDHEEVDAR